MGVDIKYKLINKKSLIIERYLMTSCFKKLICSARSGSGEKFGRK
jgi:hypothetical protein